MALALWSDNWLGRKAGGGAKVTIYISFPDNVRIMPPISEVDGHRFVEVSGCQLQRSETGEGAAWLKGTNCPAVLHQTYSNPPK